MADPRFFTKAGPFTLADIAAKIGAEIKGGDVATQVTDVAPLDAATPADVSFFDNPRYKDALATTKAGAVIIAPDSVDLAPEGIPLLVTDAAYPAYASTALMGLFVLARGLRCVGSLFSLRRPDP